jgi:hypothetical protein
MPINTHQIAHYKDKLQYEIDSWDLSQAMKQGEGIVVIGARSVNSCQKEHIPGAINFLHRTMTKELAQAQLNMETRPTQASQPMLLIIKIIRSTGCISPWIQLITATS